LSSSIDEPAQRDRRKNEGADVPTVVAYHEVDDTDHWLASPKRAEFFGPIGIGFRTFVNPENPTHVALILELPDTMSMTDLQTALQSPEAAAAEAHDGVRVDTLMAFVER
jgi:hypothetical protein